jgi:hypothetical protein
MNPMGQLRRRFKNLWVAWLPIAWLGIVVASCGPSRERDPQTSKPMAPPSATEVFHLRSECEALGENIMGGNIIGRALTQSQTSHYDPATNRCYVELNVNTADLTQFSDYFSRYLYDGQTGEMLAFTTTDHGKKTSGVFALRPPSTGDPFLDASSTIDSFMADDRGRGRE